MRGKRFVGVGLGVVVAASVAAALLSRETSPFELGFFFGEAIENVARGRGTVDAVRLPFLPYLLGGIASVSTSITLAFLLKNLLLCAPLLKVAKDWLVHAAGGRRALRIAALVFCITFPQLVRFTLALVPDEGVLIPVLAYVFHELLRTKSQRSIRVWAGVGAGIAVATLTRSTMVYFAPLLVALAGWRARSVRVLGGLALTFGLAALTTSALHLHATGRFTPTSSVDGYNLWKGNNEHTLDHFPFRSLDALSDGAPPMREGESEWSWNARCYDAAITFDVEHPRQALEILGWRFFQVFVSVVPEESPTPSDRRAFRFLGIGHMLVFRVLFWVAIAWSVRAVFRAWRRREDPDGGERTRARAAVLYLVFVAGFVAPYLVAWGVQHRLLPLVIPTVLYVCWVIDADARSA